MAVVLPHAIPLHPLTRDAFANGKLVGRLEGYNRPDENGEMFLHEHLQTDGTAFMLEEASVEGGYRFFEHPGIAKLCSRDPNFAIGVELSLEGDELVLQPLKFGTAEPVGRAHRIPIDVRERV